MDRCIQSLANMKAALSIDTIRDRFNADVGSTGLRKPNITEAQQWLIIVLRSHYLTFKYNPSKYSYSKETYYSLKGEVRRYSFLPVLNFLHKRGMPNIMEDFEKYINTESVYKIGSASVSYHYYYGRRDNTWE